MRQSTSTRRKQFSQADYTYCPALSVYDTRGVCAARRTTFPRVHLARLQRRQRSCLNKSPPARARLPVATLISRPAVCWLRSERERASGNIYTHTPTTRIIQPFICWLSELGKSPGSTYICTTPRSAPALKCWPLVCEFVQFFPGCCLLVSLFARCGTIMLRRWVGF